MGKLTRIYDDLFACLYVFEKYEACRHAHRRDAGDFKDATHVRSGLRRDSVSRGDGAELVVEAFAADPDRCAAEAYAEERRTIGPDHGALAAGRTVLALSLAEPLEKIEIQLGGHMADGSAVENRFQGDARPILRVHPFDFLSAALDTHMARRARSAVYVLGGLGATGLESPPDLYESSGGQAPIREGEGQ